MNDKNSELETDYEPIDLCECYEPLFYPLLELVKQWRKCREVRMEDKFEPTLENTSHYGTLDQGGGAFSGRKNWI